MNKILLFFLCLLMILLLAACGQDSATIEPMTTGNSEAGGPESTANTISGLVFYDGDGNGILDNGESGLEGVVILCEGQSYTTNGNGKFELSTENGTAELSVDESSLDGEYILTTGNNVQTVEISGGTGTASDIGYTSADSNIIFSEVLKDGSEFNNYHFILEMTLPGQTTSSEIWVMDSNLKFAGEGQIVYYNTSEGTMGVYLAATNQLTVAPITEAIEIETPFTLAEEVDLEASDRILYTGTEELDGKSVYIFEVTGFGKYYVWADNGIIIKMEVESDGSYMSYYFRDLSIGTVTMDDFAYPAGAEIIDLSAFGS